MANKDLQSWVRLDASWLHNPKVRRAGLFGRALWIAGVLYAYRQDTDGAVSADVLDLLATEAGLTMEQAQEAASKLLEVGLWEREPDGWHIHDYETCQETSEERETRRSQDRERQRRRRAKGVAKQANRDLPTGVTRDTSVSHGGVLDPEAEADTEEENFYKTSRVDTHHDDTSQPPSISPPPDGGRAQTNDQFDEFWAAYPKRDGRKVGKAPAQAQWRRLDADQRAIALVAVTHYAAERGNPGQLSPEDAQRWLRDRRFVDWAEPADTTTPTRRNGRDIAARLANLKGA